MVDVFAGNSIHSLVLFLIANAYGLSMTEDVIDPAIDSNLKPTCYSEHEYCWGIADSDLEQLDT